MWLSPDNWKERTVVTLTCGTNTIGKSYACITSKNLLVTKAIQKWSGHSSKQMDFLSLEVFKWVLSGHLMLGLTRNMFERLVGVVDGGGLC